MIDNYFAKVVRGELPQPRSALTFQRNITHYDVDAGTLEADFVVGEAFLNPAGMVQGGILVALLDDTLGPALAMLLADDQRAPLLNVNASFVRPGNPGRFTGHARVVNKGRTVAFLEGRLLDAGGKLVATATATAAILGASR